jgi:hypothetical protein
VLTVQLLHDGHHLTVVDTQWFGNHLSAHPNLTVRKQDTRDVDAIPFKSRWSFTWRTSPTIQAWR